MEVFGSLKVSFLGFRLSCARIIGKIGNGVSNIAHGIVGFC